MALHQILLQIQQKLPPLQLGVAVSDLMAHLTHSVRCAHQLCLDNSNVGILQIDISNAFNTLQRETILNHIYADFPQISRWIQWSLCHAGALLSSDAPISSTTGCNKETRLAPSCLQQACRASWPRSCPRTVTCSANSF